MCGITAAIRYKNNIISNEKMKILLIGNKGRGSNSTGIATVSDKGVIDVNKILESPLKALEDQLLIDATQENAIMLLHNRAPSVGMDKTINAAQPIEHNNTVLIHNGTIHNHEILAKKYGVSCNSTETDSMILAKILDSGKFDVLNDYNGAASLIWFYRNEPDSIYVFRGESKTTSYVANQSDERPLYVLNSAEGIYFGSEDDALNIIAESANDLQYIEEVKANTVIKCSFTNESITEICSVDRSRSQQNKVYVATTTTAKPKTYPPKKTIGFDYNTHKNKANVVKSFNEDRVSYVGDTGILKLVQDNTRIYHELRNPSIVSSKVIYYRGRYWRDSKLMNGIFSISDDGMINASGLPYAFIHGYLLSTVMHYSALALNAISIGDIGSAMSLELLSNKTEQPIIRIFANGSFLLYKDKSASYDGVYEPKFVSYKYYEINNGTLTDYYNFKLDEVKVDSVITKDDGDHFITADSDSNVGCLNTINEFNRPAYIFESDILLVDGKSAKPGLVRKSFEERVLVKISEMITEDKIDDEKGSEDEKDFSLIDDSPIDYTFTEDDVKEAITDVITSIDDSIYSLGLIGSEANQSLYPSISEKLKVLETMKDYFNYALQDDK